MVKYLKCRFCGKELKDIPYNKNLDGRISHPKCVGRDFDERFKQFVGDSNGKD